MDTNTEELTDMKVAEWMLAQLESKTRLDQGTAVHQIGQKFGKDFVYQNASGNLAISKSVLKNFNKLSEGLVIWEKGEKAWRKLRDDEVYNGRQVD
jgi:hypothetical protein